MGVSDHPPFPFVTTAAVKGSSAVGASIQCLIHPVGIKTEGTYRKRRRLAVSVLGFKE